MADIRVRVESGRVFLNYSYRRNGGEWESLDYPVALEKTACHYGGGRYWFRCPAAGCGRRVALLYGTGRYFACRHCYQLAYASQREARHNRLARRADKLRARLQWEPGILHGPGGKPKGMHWRTFYRLSREVQELTGESTTAFLAHLKKINLPW